MSRSLSSFNALRQSLPCIPSSSRAIHTSAPAHAVRSQARQKRDRKEAQAKLTPGVPDFVLGNISAKLDDRGRANQYDVISSTWDDCRLAKCLIHPQTVWNSPLPDYANGEKPQYLLPGLSKGDEDVLFGAVPHVSTALQYNPNVTPEVRDEVIRETMESQEKQTEMMYRILDLRNASRSQINAFNRRRVINEFGKGTDTGSSFVQAALITLQIRGLNEHMLSNKKDINNRIRMRKLIMDRARHLKYIKRKYPNQYDQILLDLGLCRRAVEGELTTHL